MDEFRSVDWAINELYRRSQAVVGKTTWSGEWYDHPMLFPTAQFPFKLLNADKSKVTFAYPTSARPQVMQFYLDQKPGLKGGNGTRTGKSENAIHFLGKVPSGFIPEWNNRGRKSFPPPAKTRTLECQVCMKGTASCNSPSSEKVATVTNGDDADSMRNTEQDSGSKKKKTTHLQDKKCSFACVERELSIGDMSLLTFEKGKHVHSCKQHNLHMLPLDASEQLLLLRLLMAFPSVKELWQKVVEPAIARCQQNGRIPTRLLNLTETDLNRHVKALRERKKETWEGVIEAVGGDESNRSALWDALESYFKRTTDENAQRDVLDNSSPLAVGCKRVKVLSEGDPSIFE